MREEGSVERLNNALCKMSGSWKKSDEGRKEGTDRSQKCILIISTHPVSSHQTGLH